MLISSISVPRRRACANKQLQVFLNQLDLGQIQLYGENQTLELGSPTSRYNWNTVLLLGATVSLVAKGNGVPGLFPVTNIFVALVQRLQVRRQDQTSDRHRQVSVSVSVSRPP